MQLSFLPPLFGILSRPLKKLPELFTALESVPATPVPVAPAPPLQPAAQAQPALAPAPRSNALPVEAFLADDHKSEGVDHGYRGHSNDDYNNQLAAKAALYKLAIQASLKILKAKILVKDEELVDAGPMPSGMKSKLELERKALQEEHDRWESQYRMDLIPNTDSESEFNVTKFTFSAGYQAGWDRYNRDKLFGDNHGVPIS